MRVKANLVGFLAVLIFASSPLARPASEPNVLKMISRELSKLKSVVAVFRQKVPLAGTGVVREAEGKLYFVSGLGSRWDYISPAFQTFIVMEDRVYYREGKEGDYEETRIPPETLRLFQTLIGGDALLETLFTQGRVKIDEDGLCDVELIPLGKVKRVAKRVIMTWDAKGKTVRKIAIYGTSGLSNLIVFEKVEKNAPVPHSLFELR